MAKPTVSRQRLWQIRMQKEGRCQKCGGEKETSSKVYCQSCERKSIDTSMRRYYDRKSQGLCPRCGRRIEGAGAAFCPRPVENYEDAAACDHEAFGRFFHAMLRRGVWLPPSSYEAMFISSAHDDEVIDRIVDAATASFQAIST